MRIIMLLLFCLLLSCKPLTYNINAAPDKIDVYQPIPDSMPVHILYAEDRVPEKSFFVDRTNVVYPSTYYGLGLTGAVLQAVIDQDDNFSMVNEAKKKARKLGANMIQVFETNGGLFSNNMPELYLYRNMELDSAEFDKKRNASLLPMDAKYAKIYFYSNEYYSDEYVVIHNRKDTVGVISMQHKFEFKTDVEGIHTFIIPELKYRVLAIDVKAGQEYYVKYSKDISFGKSNKYPILMLEKNYRGRHYYNSIIATK